MRDFIDDLHVTAFHDVQIHGLTRSTRNGVKDICTSRVFLPRRGKAHE
jgi:hypothetical protein